MLHFRMAYLKAMREHAPQMFQELRRNGVMEAHLDAKVMEATEMFSKLTEGVEKLPSGALANPSRESMATEQVFSTLIDF